MEFPTNWHKMSGKEKVKWIEENEEEIKTSEKKKGERL